MHAHYRAVWLVSFRRFIPALVICCSLLLGSRTPARSATWVETLEAFRSSPLADTYASAVDAAGNIYVGGSFTGAIRLGSHSLEAPEHHTAAFVAKMDPLGTWLWAIQSLPDGDGPSAVAIKSMAVDRTGRVYVAGRFHGAAKFGKHRLVAKGWGDTWAGLLTTAGQWHQVSRTGSEDDKPQQYGDSGAGITVDAKGDVYLTGTFQHADGRHIFVDMKLRSGKRKVVTAMGNGRLDRSHAIARDKVGNVYITGSFSQGKFGDLKVKARAAYDIFVAKLDAEGTWQWVAQAGTTGANNRGLAVVVNALGEIYVAGGFEKQAAFGSTTLKAMHGGKPAAYGTFVAKLNPQGDWVWAKQIDNQMTAFAPPALALDGKDGVYLSGSFSKTITLGDTKLTARGGTAGFVAKLNPLGHWDWARHIGDAGMVITHTVHTDKQGDLYIAGLLRGVSDFDGTTVNPGQATEAPPLQSTAEVTSLVNHAASVPQRQEAVRQAERRLQAAQQTLAAKKHTYKHHRDRERDYWHRAAAAAKEAKRLADQRGSIFDITRNKALAAAKLAEAITWKGKAEKEKKRVAAARAAERRAAAAVTNRQKTLDAEKNRLQAAWKAVIALDAPDKVESLAATRRFLARLDSNGKWIKRYRLTVAAVDAHDKPYDPVKPATPALGTAWHLAGEVHVRAAPTSRRTAQAQAIFFNKPMQTVEGTKPYTCTGWKGQGSVPERGWQCELTVALSEDSTITWKYEKSRTWIIGQAVAPPPEAVNPQTKHPYAAPEFIPQEAMQAFVWNTVEHKLYAVQPATATLKWRVSPVRAQPPADLNDPYYKEGRLVRGTNIWPDEPQIHIAGTPVDLADPDTADLTLVNLRYTSHGAATVAVQQDESGKTRHQFHNAEPGTFSVLWYVRGPSADVSQYPPVFQVIETVAWNDPAYLTENHTCRIGQALTEASHRDPSGKNGYVVHPGARYDPTIHQRQDRSGPIVPVNTDTEAPEDDLVVAWYAPDTHGVAWSTRTVRYHCRWPSEAPQLVIANQRGSGPLDPQQYIDMQIYHQPDPERAGYNPNEEHALFATVGDKPVLFALRADLNRPDTSEPYVLLKYRHAATGDWRFTVYRVTTEGAGARLDHLAGTAGRQLQAPAPLHTLDVCAASHGVSGPYHEDHRHTIWAKAAGEVVMRWFYPLQKSFWYDPNGDGKPDAEVGTCVPWLDLYAETPGTPIDVRYQVQWPKQVPTLRVGETLIRPKHGLPDIGRQQSVEVIHDQAGVRLFQPLQPYTAPLQQLPDHLKTLRAGDTIRFPDLAPHLYQRLAYDPRHHLLRFRGVLDTSGSGEPLLLLNVMSQREHDELLQISGSNAAWRTAIESLYEQSRAGLSQRTKLLGSGSKALSAGAVHGTGYVTLVFNDDPSLQNLPVTLAVLKVDCPVYIGQIQVLPAANVFDEALTLRHSGDFGGDPDRLRFEWRFRGGSQLVRGAPDATWRRFGTTPSDGRGAVAITIRGARPETLSDNWVFVRYTGYAGLCAASTSAWAGAPGSDPAAPTPQLAAGWIKRVLDGLNPFEARVKAFHTTPTNTYASMLTRAGPRYTGDIPFNPAADNLNDIGLIQAYTTVLRRGKQLSIDATPPIQYAPANDALLLVASRIADLYMLLGNEAAADASDPTIAFTTAAGLPDNRATALFAFTNQVASLLDEELALWRGRDASSGPVRASPYNHLVWNFTRGEGEVAYEQTYHISDHNHDGTVDEQDARIRYPQGHGDAWGHYLTAITTYYDLLRHPHYRWMPRTEAVLVAGTPVQVDYLDERKFARAAAAKAKAGAEIVQLTYRRRYAEDPARQWQGYRDPNAARAWGLAEWAARAGQGAYFDWVVGNAILPARACADPAACAADDTRLTVIDRSTVRELREVVSQFRDIEAQMDQADQGLNPLGLARDVVPFDIDPDLVAHYVKTHFDQIDERAVQALQHAQAGFEYATQQSQALRSQQETVATFRRQIRERDIEYRNRLIDIFGYPYPDDIGPGGTYPADYDGPDIYHYDYVDVSPLVGVDTAKQATQTFTMQYLDDLSGMLDQRLLPRFDEQDRGGVPIPFTSKRLRLNPTQPGRPVQMFREDERFDVRLRRKRRNIKVTYEMSTAGLGLVKPADWTGQRRAPGEIQIMRSELLQNLGLFKQARHEYDNLLKEIDEKIVLLEEQRKVHLIEETKLRDTRTIVKTLSAGMIAARTAQKSLRRASEGLTRLAEVSTEAMPKVAGTSNDVTAALRATTKGTYYAQALATEASSDVFEIGETAASLTMQNTEAITQTELLTQVSNPQELRLMGQQLMQLLRQEATLRLNLQTRYEAALQTQGRYLAALATGERLLQELARFRRDTAAQVQDYRYQDMSYRIFRNEALQQYRKQFDLAARYAYLAAKVYDYETNGLSHNGQTAEDFLVDIIRQRGLGALGDDNQPLPGTGLADVLARMQRNFDELKPKLGLNNPQKERPNRFSLRWELLRIGQGAKEDARWRAALRQFWVADLNTVPAYRDLCRPIPSRQAAQPGLVLPFWTTITPGYNLFGWPATTGDSIFSSTHFVTKIRGVAVGLAGYKATGLISTPRVYLVPAGLDIMRTPRSSEQTIRKWRVVDQWLSLPFDLGAHDPGSPGQAQPVYVPYSYQTEVRRFPDFPAYNDASIEPQDDTLYDSRLIGRSVWNTEWVLIIPGINLAGDPQQGLASFIGSDDHKGVSDIALYFQTYAYSGN